MKGKQEQLLVTTFNKIDFKKKYLGFLGAKEENPSFEYLRRLMKSHLYKVPFDGSNFTLHHPENFTLKAEEILQNFTEKKGGMCYQSNGAFKELLIALGFNAKLVTVTMFRFGSDPIRPYAEKGHDVHCAILVSLEEKEYLVDLVWGNAFRRPLPVNGNVLKMTGEPDRKCVKENDKYQLLTCNANVWEAEYQFKDEDRTIESFSDDIKYLCSKEHHLYYEALFMKPLPKKGFLYVWRRIFDEKGEPLKNGAKAEIKLSLKSPAFFQTKEEVITDKNAAATALKQFGVTDQNCNELLNKIF